MASTRAASAARPQVGLDEVGRPRHEGRLVQPGRAREALGRLQLDDGLRDALQPEREEAERGVPEAEPEAAADVVRLGERDRGPGGAAGLVPVPTGCLEPAWTASASTRQTCRPVSRVRRVAARVAASAPGQSPSRNAASAATTRALASATGVPSRTARASSASASARARSSSPAAAYPATVGPIETILMPPPPPVDPLAARRAGSRAAASGGTASDDDTVKILSVTLSVPNPESPKIVKLARKLRLPPYHLPASPDYEMEPSSGPIGMWPSGYPG